MPFLLTAREIMPGVTLSEAIREYQSRSPTTGEGLRPSQIFDAVGVTLIPTRVDAHAPGAQADGDPLDRYELRTEIGRGGMGRVVEAYDPELRRVVAVKLLLGGDAVSEAQLARFVAEAQITSQLQHPAIIPVYDFGITPHGVLYYVMKRISGRSLREILDALREGDEVVSKDWGTRALLAAFLRVCEAVAYAHSCGVLHRDLKPDNIMLGAFGEVLVLDWGVARLIHDTSEVVSTQEIERVTMAQTLDGALIGTPGFMSPEQLRGAIHELDGRSDQWSLGAILYEILTLQDAYTARNLLDLVFRMSSPPVDPRQRSPHREIDEVIANVSLRALAPNKEDRFDSVVDLAAEVRAFLEGAKRRERAFAIIQEGLPLEARAQAMRKQADALRHKAAQRLEAIPAHAPSDDKLEAWELEREAERLELDAERTLLEFQHAMQTALKHAPDLEAPHIHLADHYRALHARAERDGDRRSAYAFETLLRLHDQGRHAEYLAGRGALTLVTEPPGAEAVLYRFEERARRLQPCRVGSLGSTPLHAVELDMGSYLIELHHEGRETVRYPVVLSRHDHWDGTPEGASAPAPVPLPVLGSLGPDDCYVPPGGCWIGGDPEAPGSFERYRVWVEGFVIKRFPVTNTDYIAFLDALVESGREDEALRHVPRERAGTVGELGAMIYGRDAAGHFHLRPDADGDIWLPEWPVTMIDWWGAHAYAMWFRETHGAAWRLPSEIEWEKAARGVDGRIFPWGDYLDPSWLCMRDSHAARKLPTHIRDHPIDRSPYGVRGLGGNVVDWCADLKQARPHALPPALEDTEAERVQRGGAWNYPETYCRAARRLHSVPSSRGYDLGLRLARSLT